MSDKPQTRPPQSEVPVKLQLIHDDVKSLNEKVDENHKDVLNRIDYQGQQVKHDVRAEASGVKDQVRMRSADLDEKLTPGLKTQKLLTLATTLLGFALLGGLFVVFLKIPQPQAVAQDV